MSTNRVRRALGQVFRRFLADGRGSADPVHYALWLAAGCSMIVIVVPQFFDGADKFGKCFVRNVSYLDDTGSPGGGGGGVGGGSTGGGSNSWDLGGGNGFGGYGSTDIATRAADLARGSSTTTNGASKTTEGTSTTTGDPSTMPSVVKFQASLPVFRSTA